MNSLNPVISYEVLTELHNRMKNLCVSNQAFVISFVNYLQEKFKKGGLDYIVMKCERTVFKDIELHYSMYFEYKKGGKEYILKQSDIISQLRQMSQFDIGPCFSDPSFIILRKIQELVQLLIRPTKGVSLELI